MPEPKPIYEVFACNLCPQAEVHPNTFIPGTCRRCGGLGMNTRDLTDAEAALRDKQNASAEEAP